MVKIVAPTTQKDKQLGLLILDKPPQDWGMLFFDTSTIHTMNMKFPIDVVSLDINFKIIEIKTIDPGVESYSIPGTKHILELAPTSAYKLGFTIGSYLTLKI